MTVAQTRLNAVATQLADGETYAATSPSPAMQRVVAKSPDDIVGLLIVLVLEL